MYERNSSPNASLTPAERRGKEILTVIQNHRTEVDAEAKEWAKDLLAYRNKFWKGHKIDQNEGPNGTTMQAPYLHSFTDVMVSNIVPPHPAVDIRTRRTAKKDAAKLRSFYVNDLMDKDNAVNKGKGAGKCKWKDGCYYRHGNRKGVLHSENEEKRLLDIELAEARDAAASEDAWQHYNRLWQLRIGDELLGVFPCQCNTSPRTSTDPAVYVWLEPLDGREHPR